MNPILRGSVKSKLMWLGLIVGVGGYLQLNLKTLAPFIPSQYFGLIDITLGGAVMIARFFTTESLADKGTTQEPAP